MRSSILHSVVGFAALSCAIATAGETRIDDVLQTMRVRHLLHEDEELRGQNIGVYVQNGVAILWGPIGKLDMGLRAESCLRGLPEIRDVRNELIVQELPIRFATTRAKNIPGMPIEPAPRTPPAIPPASKSIPAESVPSANVIRQ